MSAAKVDKPEGLFCIEGISLLVFNKDYTQCALSKQDNNIYIYEVKDIKKPDGWKLLHTLKAHVGFISGLDWNAFTNEIVSVSYDKTAYVWTFSSGKWESNGLVATTQLGFLNVKWNSRGDKFCTGTSGNKLFIAYFNTNNSWWMARNIKGHKSSVTSCVIDPTSLFVLSGSTDLRIYMHSCYLPEVDDKHLNDVTSQMKTDFGTMIYEFRANTWINSVGWNQSGTIGYAACQNSTIAVVDWKEQNQEIIKLPHSPVNMIIPKGEDGFYAISFDRNIYEYAKKDGKWEKVGTVTEEKAKTGPAKAVSSSVSDRLKKFQTMGQQKKENLAVSTKQTSHLHKSLIISAIPKDKTMITSDVTGFIRFWDI